MENDSASDKEARQWARIVLVMGVVFTLWGIIMLLTETTREWEEALPWYYWLLMAAYLFFGPLLTIWSVRSLSRGVERERADG